MLNFISPNTDGPFMTPRQNFLNRLNCLCKFFDYTYFNGI